MRRLWLAVTTRLPHTPPTKATPRHAALRQPLSKFQHPEEPSSRGAPICKRIPSPRGRMCCADAGISSPMFYVSFRFSVRNRSEFIKHGSGYKLDSLWAYPRLFFYFIFFCRNLLPRPPLFILLSLKESHDSRGQIIWRNLPPP